MLTELNNLNLAAIKFDGHKIRRPSNFAASKIWWRTKFVDHRSELGQTNKQSDLILKHFSKQGQAHTHTHTYIHTDILAFKCRYNFIGQTQRNKTLLKNEKLKSLERFGTGLKTFYNCSHVCRKNSMEKEWFNERLILNYNFN